MEVVLFILHLICTIMSTVNAAIANNNVSMILWIVAAVCWGVCCVLDIVEFTYK